MAQVKKRNPASDYVTPDFHQLNLEVEGFLKMEKGLKLDADSQICKDNLSPSGCPLGLSCPLRHTQPSSQNFHPLPPPPSNPRDREKVLTVCKHYIRGLCIMGDKCEFLHEYNRRSFGECWWYGTYGFCAVGEECLYDHRRGEARRAECPDYNRGFCVLGPDCPRKHIRRILCPSYLAGFCPDGPKCKKGHPSPNLPQPSAYLPPPPPLSREIGPPPPGYGRYADYDPYNPQPWQVWQKGAQLIEGFVAPGGGGGYQGGYGGGGGGGVQPGGKGWKEGKDLAAILCFKCDTYGHYANTCTNQAKAGDRGGLARRQKEF